MTDETDLIDLAECVDRMAAVIDLPLAPEYRSGVIENFRQIQAIAQFVMEFPLPKEVEAAPVFQP